MQIVFGVLATFFAVALSYVNRRIGYRMGVRVNETAVYLLARALQEQNQKE
jgi:hypothetical protein